MLENKEILDKLLKRLKSPVFRFVIVKTIADAYFSERIKKRIEKEIPERKAVSFAIQNKDYRQLMDSIYAFENGIVLIEDFDKLLENKDLSIGFNQRRDKFAQLGIALVVFVNSKESIQKIMSDLPDLWSVRTPVIELDYRVIKKEDFQITTSQSIGNSDTNIGKEAAKENIKVLNKRLEKLEIKAENLNLINSTYFRLFNNYDFLGWYKEGFSKLIEFEKIVIQYNYEKENSEIYTEFLNNLASFNSALGNYQKALEFNNKAILIREEIYDKNHPSLVTSYNNVAMVYQNLGNYQKALVFNDKAITIEEKIYDKNHPSLATSYNNVAGVYDNLGNYQKALVFNDKAITIEEKIYDKNHPSLATSYNNVASIYQSLGNYQKAFAFYSKAISVFEKIYDKDHSSLANSYNNVANLYYDLKNYQKAKFYNNKSLRILKKKLPAGHPHIKSAENLEKKINLAIQFIDLLKKSSKTKK